MSFTQISFYNWKACYYLCLWVTKYSNVSLRIIVSVPDHFRPAKCREWSGTINLKTVTRVVTGIGTGVATDTFIKGS